MSAYPQTLSPVALGLDRFARVAPAREPIAGEDQGSCDAFHAGRGETCRSHERGITAHHGAIVELERRREVRRDFDALRRSRPVDIDDADIDSGAVAQ